MKKLITAIALTASIGFASAAQSDTLAQILLSDGDMFDSDQTDFDIVTQAILACSDDLVAGASNPEASLTAFLPTDKAFRILVSDVFGTSIKDEAALFGAIAGTFDCGTIETILKYHVVPGTYYASDVLGVADGTPLTTLSLLDITVDFKGKGQIRLVDNEPMLRDPIIRATDIMADNGVAHVIDRVLLPIAVIEE